MEKLQGVISKVRFSTEACGGNEKTHKSYMAAFEIDNTPVELKLPGSIILDNGDEVLLAGKIKKGIFKALAYKNLTNKVSGKGPIIRYMFLGIVFSMVGLAIIPFGIGLILVPAGIYMIWYGKKLSKAYKLVTS